MQLIVVFFPALNQAAADPTCSEKPSTLSKVGWTFSYSCYTVPVQLHHAYDIQCLTALVDSGAMVNLIDHLIKEKSSSNVSSSLLPFTLLYLHQILSYGLPLDALSKTLPVLEGQ